MGAGRTTTRKRNKQSVAMRAQRGTSRRAAGDRRGALLSLELLIVLPIVVILALAMVELGLLWEANQQVKLASEQGCRVASLPGSGEDEIRAAIDAALIKPRLIENAAVVYEIGSHTGDAVAVQVKLPMNAASPDMLFVFGFGLHDRFLEAQTVMRKE